MTTQPINRTLYHSDNLAVLRGMDTGTIDLIATDPPFNSGRDFHADAGEFQDRWHWDERIHQQWVDDLTLEYPRVFNVIDGARLSYGDDMGAFLCFMGVRLLEMRRVLKPTGSIYLHCDPTASHYLKALMDAVFGRKQFRNHITWQRKNAPMPSQHEIRKFGNSTDCILFYAASPDAIFNAEAVMKPYDDFEKRYRFVDEKGRYARSTPFCSSFIGPRPNLCYEYKGVTAPHQGGWATSKAKTEALDAAGEIDWVNGKPYRKVRPGAGVMLSNCWTDIGKASRVERLGYPTQKPLALYERIIRASSNEGDVVLDPFCGCATTCIAAERLGRKWIGIDLWAKAPDVIIDRFRREGILDPQDKPAGQISLTRKDLHFHTEPPVRTDAGELTVPAFQVPIGKRKRTITLSNAERREALTTLHGAVCQGCGYVPPGADTRYLELDHIDPVAQGGDNVLENLVFLCPPCNKDKRHNLTVLALRQQNKREGRMKGEVKDIRRIRAENRHHREEIIQQKRKEAHNDRI